MIISILKPGGKYTADDHIQLMGETGGFRRDLGEGIKAIFLESRSQTKGRNGKVSFF